MSDSKFKIGDKVKFVPNIQDFYGTGGPGVSDTMILQAEKEVIFTIKDRHPTDPWWIICTGDYSWAVPDEWIVLAQESATEESGCTCVSLWKQGGCTCGYFEKEMEAKGLRRTISGLWVRS